MNMTHPGNMFKGRFLGFIGTYSGSFGLTSDPQICVFRKHPRGYNIAGRNPTLRSIVFFFLKQRVRRRSDCGQWRELWKSGPGWGSGWGSAKLQQSTRKTVGT